MRKVFIVGAVMVFGLVGTAWAGAKDKSQNTLVDRNATGILDNTTAKTKIKTKGCSLQIQAATLASPLDVDETIVICVAGADLFAGAGNYAGNSIILAGETKKGKLKIKADLGEGTLFGQGCGDLDSVTFASDLKCYLDDITYRSDATGAGTWRDACTAQGMIPGDAVVGTQTFLKKNPTVPVVIGLCQGVPPSEGVRILPPPSTEWAILGQRTAEILP